MAWEIELFGRTRLADHQNCLRLLAAYADTAPLWERTLLAAYVGIGPPVARLLGGNTKTVWQQAESIITDLLAVSEMSPREVIAALRGYIRIKRKTSHHLPFEQACERIYNQSFYPLVTHFTFAFQSSAVARLRFVRRVATALALAEATVVDLGCGSGVMLTEVLQTKPRWTGFGLDISGASVAYARRLAHHKGVDRQAHFQRGNIAELPFATGTVDLVIASEVIEHLPDPQAAFSEIARVLVPGGFVVLTIPIDSQTPAHLSSLSDADEFTDLCREAGLTVESLSTKWHLTFGDDPRHLFAVAQLAKERMPALERVYSWPAPQISSAASSGIVSS